MPIMRSCRCCCSNENGDGSGAMEKEASVLLGDLDLDIDRCDDAAIATKLLKQIGLACKILVLRFGSKVTYARKLSLLVTECIVRCPLFVGQKDGNVE